MKSYFKRFRVPFIIVGVLAVIFTVTLILVLANVKDYSVRGNLNAPKERVYDFGELLTDSEENELRELIAETEPKIGCDIVIVTLNQPIRDYAEYYEQNYLNYSVGEDQYVMVYADNFYDNFVDTGVDWYNGSAYGYNEPWGDGVLLLDNWDRTDSIYGYAYNWISTSGRCEDKLSSYDISEMIDHVNEIVNDDPCEAYKRFIWDIEIKMTDSKSVFVPGCIFMGLIASVISALVYLVKNLRANTGVKTTTATTYVPSGKVNVNRRVDLLVNTHVSSYKISTSSGGGGGGGHHSSSGGHSHGGGGGHH